MKFALTSICERTRYRGTPAATRNRRRALCGILFLRTRSRVLLRFLRTRSRALRGHFKCRCVRRSPTSCAVENAEERRGGPHPPFSQNERELAFFREHARACF